MSSSSSSSWCSSASEWLVSRILVSILLSLIHLLLELLGLLFIRKRQTGQTLLELEGVEKDPVLVVGKGVVDFLVPYHAAVGRLDEK